jgi:hypothetical protein
METIVYTLTNLLEQSQLDNHILEKIVDEATEIYFSTDNDPLDNHLSSLICECNRKIDENNARFDAEQDNLAQTLINNQ